MDREAPPLVTVLMTMFNAAAHLREAVGSVLAQTFTDFEFVIVDDGSTDHSAAIVEGFRDGRIRLVRNSQNKGQTACLNEGLALARGKWVARQDADDVSLPRRIERQMERLRRDETLALIGCQAWIVDERGQFSGLLDVPLGPGSIEWAALFENPFIHTAATFRREVVTALGGYDPSFRICQDYDLWMRVAAEHRTANLAERLVVYRHSPHSLQHSGRETVRDEVLRVLRGVASRAFSRPLAETEIAALMQFRAGIGAEELVGFLKLHALWLTEYRRDHSGTTTPEFRRVLARQRAQLGRHLISERPLAGLTQLAHAFALNPPLLLELLAAQVRGRLLGTP